MGMPNRFYKTERPRKDHALPEVLSKEEIVNNIKHRCILSLLYAAGRRKGERINFRTKDKDLKRMVVKV
ncbi:MAG: integrase/recombinase XerD [Algoriphagus sp.]|jgi:integrase/recombinase XerD